MPTYAFKNTKTEEVFELFMRMSEREEYLKNNPDLEQIHLFSPSMGNRFIEMGNLARDTPSDYKGLLKRIKKNNPGSQINTLGA